MYTDVQAGAGALSVDERLCVAVDDQLPKQVERILAFARYLSWADLLRRAYEAELPNDAAASNDDASMDHEWRSFGLMSYWYSSLYVVIEAWSQLELTDAVLDRLLAHPKHLPALLRRYRNAVFHYQPSLLDPRLLELLTVGAAHVSWIQALHGEFVRFLAEYLHGLMVTDEQRTELRQDIERAVHWYPSRHPPAVESLEHTLRSVREELARSPDDGSDARQELKRSLESAEAVLREGCHNWDLLRASILREAGVT
jgi:hypothetical protein